MPADLFQAVREAADLPALVAERVPDLRPRGGEWAGRCPFHEDKDPSFTLFQKHGEWRYHCFGCGAHGSAVDWVAQTQGLEPLEAARELARRYGIAYEERRQSPEAAAERAEARAAAERLLRALDLADAYYRRALQNNHQEAAAARWYLARRGLGPAVASHGLGYAPTGYGLVRWLHEQGVSQADRVTAGITALAEDGREYPRMRGRVVFPQRRLDGRVVGFAGRDVTGRAKAKYWNTPETPVYHKGRELYGLAECAGLVRRTGRAVVVEGPADALALQIEGLPAVAVQGSTLTAEQAALLKRAGATDAVLVPDGDGRFRLGQALAHALEAGLPLRVVTLPPEDAGGKWDPDRVAREPAGGAFGERTSGARWLAEAVEAAPGVWRTLCERIAEQGLEAQALPAVLERELKPLWELAAPAVRELMAQEAREALGIGTRAFRRAMGDAGRRVRGGASGPPDPDTDPAERCTDRGNALRLVRVAGEDLLYCERIGRWYVWDGRRWLQDWRGLVYRKADQTIDALWHEAQRAPNGHRTELLAWAQKSEDGRRIREMIRLAQHHRPVEPQEFDPDPDLLNTPAGLVDLTTGELRPHDRAARCSKVTGVAPDPRCPTPLWTECLATWFDVDEDLIEFIQRLMGCTLFGSVDEHILPIHHGDGANGKSTFLGIFQEILGDYACTVPVAALLHQERVSVGPTPELARLHGARLAVAAEPDEGVRLAEGLIKQLTGDDVITARYLHQQPFEFRPSHTLHLAVNHLPQIRGRDGGIWRRVKRIPWTVVIPEDRRDPRLRHKLREEAPGILWWAIQGAVEYRTGGLRPPRTVEAATREYASREDVIGRFLSECCVTGEGLWCYASDLYHAYERWAEGAEAVMSQAKFGRAMTALGFRRGKSAVGGKTTYEGVGLAEGEP
ncbi:phage/plasmid primase, P4 family [Deferrisoma camini]|uniref:phage/plasmid primase, P4 family n=1 Tax=Deferrisoma camini TaxID=1035120 RepID=UPI00046CA997|nr:phage/plasmid primase, P4 family [Deferrisoma camini]